MGRTIERIKGHFAPFTFTVALLPSTVSRVSVAVCAVAEDVCVKAPLDGGSRLACHQLGFLSACWVEVHVVEKC